MILHEGFSKFQNLDLWGFVCHLFGNVGRGTNRRSIPKRFQLCGRGHLEFVGCLVHLKRILSERFEGAHTSQRSTKALQPSRHLPMQNVLPFDLDMRLVPTVLLWVDVRLSSDSMHLLQTNLPRQQGDRHPVQRAVVLPLHPLDDRFSIVSLRQSRSHFVPIQSLQTSQILEC